jgi:hypothetical protein
MRVTALQRSFRYIIFALLIALLAVAFDPARADNPYAVGGISDPAHVTQFLARLKQAMTADDHAAIAAMVKYPLTVYSSAGRPATYRNAAALSANYTRVFTPEVKAAIAAAKPNNLFARDQGVMIGNGEIWMNEIGGSMKIITVNHTR